MRSKKPVDCSIKGVVKNTIENYAKLWYNMHNLRNISHEENNMIFPKYIKGFNPRNKTFHFYLDKYSCYRCKTGVCSLDNISLQELKSLSYIHITGEDKLEYCRGMAKMFIDNLFKTPAEICLNTKCGHYDFSDGQHRTCVAARLLKMGAQVNLDANLYIQNTCCRDCNMKGYFHITENSFTFLDKIFKTKKYRNLINSEAEYKEHALLYHFD